MRNQIDKPPISRKLALAVFATVIAVAMIEVLLRFVYTNEYKSRSQNYVVDVRLQGQHLDYRRNRSKVTTAEPHIVKFRTDSRSYILPSFQYQDPDVQIAFLGGSTTECAVVAEDQRFHGLISDHLADRYRINTLNAAKSGNTLHDSINTLLNHVVYDHPDYVIVMHAANDVGVLRRQQGYVARSARLQIP